MKIRAEYLKQFFGAVSQVADEIRLKFDPTGMVAKCVDPAHVAMVDASIGKDAFMEYGLDKEVVVGLDLEKIENALSPTLTKNDNEISLEIVDTKLILVNGNLTHKIGLINTDGLSDPKVPKLNLPNYLKVDAEILKTSVKATNNIADMLVFSVTEAGLSLVSETETDSVESMIPKAQLEEFKYTEDTKSTYSLEYLMAMHKGIPKGIVGVNVGKDSPITLTFEIADGKGGIMFMLAPRIED